jgi:3-methylcrotonyl-CoA carboxylase alpha subunit
MMGSKQRAKNLISEKSNNIPIIPGYSGEDQSNETLKKHCIKIGFPVIIKASSGGGGKGNLLIITITFRNESCIQRRRT